MFDISCGICIIKAITALKKKRLKWARRQRLFWRLCYFKKYARCLTRQIEESRQLWMADGVLTDAAHYGTEMPEKKEHKSYSNMITRWHSKGMWKSWWFSCKSAGHLVCVIIIDLLLDRISEKAWNREIWMRRSESKHRFKMVLSFGINYLNGIFYSIFYHIFFSLGFKLSCTPL